MKKSRSLGRYVVMCQVDDVCLCLDDWNAVVQSCSSRGFGGPPTVTNCTELSAFDEGLLFNREMQRSYH